MPDIFEAIARSLVPGDSDRLVPVTYWVTVGYHGDGATRSVTHTDWVPAWKKYVVQARNFVDGNGDV